MSLSNLSDKAMLVGQLVRKGPEWSFEAIGEPTSGRDIRAVLQDGSVFDFLSRSRSVGVILREISICVVEGRNLAAKDNALFFRPASSDPYYIVNFKGHETKSEFRRQTLNPVWNPRPIELGRVKEAETDFLEISLFDYDLMTSDDFMGIVRVPAGELHALGSGEHTFWFELVESDEERYKNEAVSGRILIRFRIEESIPDLASSHHPHVRRQQNSDRAELHRGNGGRSGEISRDPHSSGARDDIEENDGHISLDYDYVGRKVVNLVRNVLEERSISLSTDPAKNAVTGVSNEDVRCSETLPGNTESQAMHHIGKHEESSLVSAHLREQRVVDANPEQSIGTEESQSISDGECSSSSEETWIAEAPYGSRGRLLKALAVLKRGQCFADDYVMGMAHFAGRPHLRLADQKLGDRKPVVLKFYWDEETLENAIGMHSKVSGSQYVCRILQSLKTSKTGHPPCIVFEKGTQTLRDWLLGDHRRMFDRTWCLQQILTGLADLHEKDVVHGDLKPSNVVFFPDAIAWKLIDLDGAQKAGERRSCCFTGPYAAPEVLQSWLEEGTLPVAQPSTDIWSFGVIAYEILTGAQMFGNDLTIDEICDSVLDERFKKKVDLIEYVGHREAISKFLTSNPNERWSAADALQHRVFQSDPRITWTQD